MYFMYFTCVLTDASKNGGVLWSQLYYTKIKYNKIKLLNLMCERQSKFLLKNVEQHVKENLLKNLSAEQGRF